MLEQEGLGVQGTHLVRGQYWCHGERARGSSRYVGLRHRGRGGMAPPTIIGGRPEPCFKELGFRVSEGLFFLS